MKPPMHCRRVMIHLEHINVPETTMTITLAQQTEMDSGTIIRLAYRGSHKTFHHIPFLISNMNFCPLIYVQESAQALHPIKGGIGETLKTLSTPSNEEYHTRLRRARNLRSTRTPLAHAMFPRVCASRRLFTLSTVSTVNWRWWWACASLFSVTLACYGLIIWISYKRLEWSR